MFTYLVKRGSIVGAAIFVLACGYKPIASTVPGGGKSIHVPLVKNRTPYADLVAPLTAAIRHRLARGGIRVVSGNKGAPRLHVTIVGVEGKPGMLGVENDRLVPLDTIWSIRVETTIRSTNGTMLAEPEVLLAHGRAFSGDSPTSEEALGKRRRQALLEDLAEYIARYLFEMPGS
jgi:hypothetical protein